MIREAFLLVLSGVVATAAVVARKRHRRNTLEPMRSLVHPDRLSRVVATDRLLAFAAIAFALIVLAAPSVLLVSLTP